MNLLLYKLSNKYKQGDDFTSACNIDEIDTRILHTHLVSIFRGKKKLKNWKGCRKDLKNHFRMEKMPCSGALEILNLFRL